MRSLLVVAVVLLLMLGSAYLLGPREPAPPLPPQLAGDGGWLERADELSALRLPLAIARLVTPIAALWLFVASGRSARLRRRLMERGIRNQWLLVAAYSVILTAGLFLLELPFGYAGYLLRRGFGLTAEAPVAWLLRTAAEAGVAAIPFVLGVTGLYWLLRRFPRRWWVVASGGYLLFSLAFVYLQPLVITPLFFEQRPLANPELQARILQMAARIGVAVDEVLVIDASKQGNEGNAYVTGIGGSTRIVLYDTLVETYPPDELLSVVGHEMGHWREQHIWKALALSWLMTPPALLATRRILEGLLPRWGVRAPSDVAGLPFLLLLLSLATLATLPLQNWQSRRWEERADQIAVEATGDSDAVARTFARLARQNLSDPTPGPLVESMFATHPAIGRRVASIMAGSAGP